MQQNSHSGTSPDNPRFFSEEEALDKLLGTKGSLLREQYESEMNVFLIGEMIGVKRAQVSRIEKGRNLTLTTISKVFKAMNIPAWLHLSGIGKVAL